MDWVSLTIGAAAVAFILWALYRAGPRTSHDGGANAGGSDASSSPDDYLEYLTPRPVGPSFQIDGWDGYTGMQYAVAIGLSEGVCYPVIEAGTAPPASATQTLSTSHGDQESIAVRLYASLSDDVTKADLLQEIAVGPVPITGAAIREVDVTISVDREGRVLATAVGSDGSPMPVRVTKEMLGAIGVGR